MIDGLVLIVLIAVVHHASYKLWYDDKFERGALCKQLQNEVLTR